MKLLSNITLEQLQKFQVENMDPALNILDIKLNKFEKRKQVASRLLGFNSFESIKLDKENYSQSPGVGQILIARHPKQANTIVVLAPTFAICIIEDAGYAYFIERTNLSFSDVTESLLQGPGSKYFEFEFNFEPKEIELGFSGIKTVDVNLFRFNGLRLEFDWKMRNGLIIPLNFKIETKLIERPTSENLNVNLSVVASTMLSEHKQVKHVFESQIKYQGDKALGNVTNEMILWELQQLNINRHWKSAEALIVESFDCVKIAYAFLSAQKTTKNKRQMGGGILKSCIEKWGGRYVSTDDVDLAIKLHPELLGDSYCCNISELLVMPCGERLNAIQEAKTQDYRFYIVDNLLNLFKYVESKGSVSLFDKKLFIERQDGITIVLDKPSSFYKFMMKQVDRDDPIGDFSNDAKGDRNFPKHTSDYNTIRAYMYKQICAFEAVEGFEVVWEEYLASL